MIDTLLSVVRRYAASHADPTGVAQTPIPSLRAIRATARSELQYAINRPLAALVLQGCKRVTMGPHTFDFGAGDSLLITADVPTVSQITSASVDAPYLSLVLDLDLPMIAELTVEMMAAAPVLDGAPVRIEPTDGDVADAALRLMRLLDRPAATPVLQASLVREIHYWLLTGRHGATIRRLGWPEGHVRRVARAVALLRAEFHKPLPVERLAAVAGMSPSSFHQHFHAVTSLTPLQFQKQLRLIEARRLMLSEGVTSSCAAFAVGYESVSHFTRDYHRMFGLPPARDTKAARMNGASQPARHRRGTSSRSATGVRKAATPL
jgi:AraC-like DNA-binding protein